MGLSSSQARLLNLTTRMHQIEYKAAKIEAMKLQMANESRQVYEDYLDALEKTKVQKKTINEDGSLTYIDVTSYNDFLKSGYALVVHGTKAETDYVDVYNGTFSDTAGSSPTEREVSLTDSFTICNNLEVLTLAISKTYRDENGEPLNISEALLDGKKFKNLLVNLINSGNVTIVQGIHKSDPKYNSAGSCYAEQFQHSSSSPTGWNTTSLGYKFTTQDNLNMFTDYETSISTNTGLQEVTDEIELKKAEAKYEADMKRIDTKDRKYDQDLSALEAERNAIKQEMETLKTVAKDNVERTFKLFS